MARLTKERERELVAAYKKWDPEAESVADLVARLGVAKQTLYNALRKAHVPLRFAGGKAAERGGADEAAEIADAMSDARLQLPSHLLTQLKEAWRTIEALKAENADLRRLVSNLQYPPKRHATTAARPSRASRNH